MMLYLHTKWIYANECDTIIGVERFNVNYKYITMGDRHGRKNL